MAGIKISNLPAISSPAFTDVAAFDQGSTTYKVSNSDLISLFEANIVITPSNFSGVLPIANGGTNASTAPGALTSLGALPTAGGTMTGNIVMGSNNITGISSIQFLNGSYFISFTAPALSASNNYTLPNDYPASSGYILSSTDAGVMSWVANTAGSVVSVSGTTNEVDVDNSDPQNPIVGLSATIDAPGTFTIQSTVALDAIIDDDTMATATATNVPTAESVVAYIAATAGGAGGSNTQIQYNNAGALDGDSGFTTDGAGAVALLTIDIGSTVIVDAVIDDDTMATATATNIATSESIVAYIATLVPTAVPSPGGDGTILRADTGAWVVSTSTFADTYATSTLLYSNGANTVEGLATANSAMIYTNSSGVPAWSASMTDGQLLIGTTGGSPAPATLTAGTGINITNAGGSITIDAVSSGMGWTLDATGTIAAAVDNGYICGAAGATTITLPATCAIGQVVAVEGLGAGGWVLTANAGQTIQIGSGVTSAAGSLTSAAATDNVYVLCIVANTTWRVTTTNSAGLTIA